MQIADIVVLGLVLYYAYEGFKGGLFEATLDFLKVIVAFLVAMTFFEGLSNQVLSMFGLSPRLRDAIAFIILMGGGYIGLQQLIIAYLPEGSPEHFKAIQKGGGAVAGAMGGAAAAGAILFGWSLLPCAHFVAVNEEALHFDAGEKMLRAYDRLSRRAPGGKRFPLEVVYSEPLYVDVNGNWKYDADDGDEFDDLNGDMKWNSYAIEELTTDNNGDGLYDPDAEDQFEDLNGNERWDRCLLDRYRRGDLKLEQVLEETEETSDQGDAA